MLFQFLNKIIDNIFCTFKQLATGALVGFLVTFMVKEYAGWLAWLLAGLTCTLCVYFLLTEGILPSKPLNYPSRCASHKSKTLKNN